MSLLKLLSNQGFISYNKIVAREIGVHEAILLGELCSIYTQFNCNEFYFTQERICNDTALSVKQVREAVKTLGDKGFLTITKKGIPCKNWYKLNENVIDSFFKQADEHSNVQTCCEEMDTPVATNLPNLVSQNGTAGEAKKEAVLNNNTTKNTRVRIHNTSSASAESDEGNTSSKKKSASVLKQEKILEYLNSLTAQDLLVFTKCVSTLFEFRKSKDAHFNRSSTQLEQWKYEFAVFAKESGRSSTEILGTLGFALNDQWWSQYIFNPKNFFKNYDNIFLKSTQKSTRQVKQTSKPPEESANRLFF